MLPSIFNENVFDDLFDQTMNMDMFGRRNPLYGKHAKEMMKTDVRSSRRMSFRWSWRTVI